MSSLYDAQETQSHADNTQEQPASEHQEAYTGDERPASPPWGSWHDVSLQQQQGTSELPDSPRSTGDWEMLNAAASSGHGSSSRLTQVDDHNSMEASVADMTPLHIMLTPQGSSAITMRLEPMSSAASPTKSADAVQEQFQQQLRKAKATLLPDFSMHRSSSSQDATQQPLEAAAEALPTSIHLSMQADTSDSNVESPHADEPFNSVAASDTTLPDCGSAAASDVSTVCEAQTVETAPKVDKAFQPALVSQHESASQTALGSQQDETAQHESVSQAVTEAADEEEDVQESWAGQASVMSDGSFVNVSVDQAEDSLADDTEQLEDIVAVADAVTSSVDIDEGVQEESLQLSDATKEVLDLLETEVGEEHTNESLETTPADGCADQVASDPVHEEEELHMHSSWTAAAGACIRRRLHQVLSTLQAWSTSAHNCLPAFFPSCNMSSEKLHGKPAGWDWLHYLLTGSLTVVSAALGYYIMRERVLARKLMSSNAELSKLLFKVINMQQSVQYTGRVPIIRHTSSVSALSTFPLTHLM